MNGFFVAPDGRLAPFYLQSLYESVANSTSVMGLGGFTQLFTKTGIRKEFYLDMEGKDVPIAEAYEHFLPFNVPWNKIIKRSFLISKEISFPEGVTYWEYPVE